MTFYERLRETPQRTPSELHSKLHSVRTLCHPLAHG